MNPPPPHSHNPTAFRYAAEAPALQLSITGLPSLIEIGQKSYSTLRSGTQTVIGLCSGSRPSPKNFGAQEPFPPAWPATRRRRSVHSYHCLQCKGEMAMQ